MLSIGSLSFVQPLGLLALLLLPAIWMLLRLTPPTPLILAFAPVRFLAKLKRKDESPAASPLWLLILRVLLVLTLVLGLSHPLFNATNLLRGQGALILIVDDGWASAINWQGRKKIMKAIVDQAVRQDRPVFVVTTAPVGLGKVPPKPRILRPSQAGKLLAQLQPKPWATSRKAALDPLFDLKLDQPAHVVWLSDGLEQGNSEDLVSSLQKLGTMTVFTDPPERRALLLKKPQSKGIALQVEAARALSGPPLLRRLSALDAKGGLLGGADLVFSQGESLAQGTLTLPAELRNRLTRLEIDDENTAGSVILVDERWRRRPVGLFKTDANDAKPLLSGLYYLERALAPFTEVRKGDLAQLLERELSVLILDDPGRFSEGAVKKLESWMAQGGVIVRFAGPNLEQGQRPLLPVKLRQGDRSMGGTMSWSKPVGLAPFDQQSPFFGLSIAKDVKIHRQVLAQPSPDLDEKTWARLQDGTPLITAQKRSKGWLVLVHVTASPAWSNLPLSNLYTQMLRRLMALSRGVKRDVQNVDFLPFQALDGFGRLGSPPKDAMALAGKDFAVASPGPNHPPGFYSPSRDRESFDRRAFNLASHLPDPQLFQTNGVLQFSYGTPQERDLMPWLLAVALFMMLVDLAASLYLRGLLRTPFAASLALFILVGTVTHSLGAENDIPPATLKTRLAYMITGDKQLDEISRAGLGGLSVMVNRRTTAELGAPLGVNPEKDELSFFPFIYWPGTPIQKTFSPKAASNLNAYLRNGGVIVFDARGSGDTLQNLVGLLDIPLLEPITLNHVLARSFYLLRQFQGRRPGGRIWVERPGERINDGVSSIIAGDHDWIGAWAMDDTQRPLFAVTPGGEKQREMAFRFGINLVMYALTGNYKEDQIHLPAILKRLGQ